MKMKLILFLCVLFSVGMSAQETEGNKKVTYREIPVYRDVDVMASYIGGYQSILKQIEIATKNCSKGKLRGKDTTLIIDVLITDKGKVAKVDFVKAEVSLCNEDIRKTIENSNMWKPGLIDNKPVNSYLQLKVNLKNDFDGSNSNSVRSMN